MSFFCQGCRPIGPSPEQQMERVREAAERAIHQMAELEPTFMVTAKFGPITRLVPLPYPWDDEG